MNVFIGREKQLQKLKQEFESRSASLVVVKGRRRIGKSRLIQEFGKNYKLYQFMGLNPGKGIAAMLVPL
jgi:hypothetical protein